MSSIYNLTTTQAALELVPPDKRYSGTVQWLRALLVSTVQYLHDALVTDYRLGFTGATWTAGTYARGAKVQYNKQVFVSLINGNTDTPPSSNWYMQQDDFIGLNERLAYNGTNIVLEYALNKYFGTTFRQPGGAASDIYLTTNAQPISPFIIGLTERQSSVVYLNGSSEFIINTGLPSAVPNLTVHLPSAVYNNGYQRAFIDKYVNSGIIYQVVSY